MKRIVLVTALLVLFASCAVFAAEGNPNNGMQAPAPTLVEVGPYAKVMAQRVVVEPNGWWYVWNEGIPGMDFGFYSGQAGFGKVADSNAFILETNTGVTLTFNGQSLTHELGDKMLTRYWAWTSRGVDNLPKPYLFVNFPDQIQPLTEIGYFGEAGSAPHKDSGRSAEQIIFDVMQSIVGTDFWPSGNWATDVEQAYGGVTHNGIYAFQVFGFASTDEISSQRAGDYVGRILLTVAK